MRTLPCVLCCLLFLSLSVNAQIINSPDCRSAIPICADGLMVISPEVGGSGDIDDFDPNVIQQTGCLEKGSNSSSNIENNTSWFVFRSGTSGQVGFDIQALPLVGTSITAEWDFAVYGPDVECADISNGTAQPIRCNYEVNDTNYTGLGVNPISGLEGAPFVKQSQNTYDEYLEVQAGEIYYVLVNNYNTQSVGDAESFNFTFTGASVDADQDLAVDCSLRDEFLGLDIIACEGDPDIVLNALRSPAGPDIQGNVSWSVDYGDDGVDIVQLTGSGLSEAEYVVTSDIVNSGRYFAVITTSSGGTVEHEGGILIDFHGVPILDPVTPVVLLDTNLSIDPDQNDIEFFVVGNSSYEYAINEGEFQDESVFMDVPAGLNTVIINDKNGCGITDAITFLVVGYPKFFTPNGDGKNETWNISGIETLENSEVFVFDRFGKILAQLSETNEWDGRFNGVDMPSTDYWFRLEYDGLEDAVIVAKTRKTHFTLKR